MSKINSSFRTFVHGLLACALAGATLATAACSTAPKSEAERTALQVDTTAFLTEARETDPTLERFFDSCAGYAVFPSIGKGGFVVGGVYGRGQLFDRSGRLLGYCDVSQGSIGGQQFNYQASADVID